MKYVWIAQPRAIINNDWEAQLFATNVKFRRGDRCYANSRGYVQKRKNSGFVGVAISMKKNEHWKSLALKIAQTKQRLGHKIYYLASLQPFPSA